MKVRNKGVFGVKKGEGVEYRHVEGAASHGAVKKERVNLLFDEM